MLEPDFDDKSGGGTGWGGSPEDNPPRRGFEERVDWRYMPSAAAASAGVFTAEAKGFTWA